ncbi:MAG: hypothetical protein D6822_00430 [Cyanobacteria bacterium J149]|nr:MAG: hypothetical protein D6822_00430 [Cyanobacteria bacterium J149]
MARSNPNKANQYKPDPRQSLFLSNYLDPKSKTFGNALQSALKAGYAQEYAEAITAKMPAWLAEKVRDTYLVSKAEENLKEFLENGDEKIKADITKFVLSRLAKAKYSERQEVTGKDGKDLVIQVVKFDEDNPAT